MQGWLVALLLVLLFSALILSRLGPKNRRPAVLMEYWVYSTVGELPNQKDLLGRLLAGNPHNAPGSPCLGTIEGKFLTDVRFRMSLALRTKNPHAFRPDLFADGAEPTSTVLQALQASSSVVRCRFLSPVPVETLDHVQFMTHLVDAVAELVRAELIYDCVCEKFIWSADLSEGLGARPDARHWPSHVSVAWKTEGTDNWLETKGMHKAGLQELVTAALPSDYRTLGSQIVLCAAQRAWARRKHQWPVEVSLHGDTFVLEADRRLNGRLRITRRLAAGP